MIKKITKLERLRRRARLTQHQLAARSGLHQGSISNMEAGLRAPKVTSLKKLSAALGCQITDLI